MRLIFRDIRMAPALFNSHSNVAINSIPSGWKCSMLNKNNFHSFHHITILCPSSSQINPISIRQFAFGHSIRKNKIPKTKEEDEDDEEIGEEEEMEPQKKKKANKEDGLDEDGLPIDYKTMEFVLISRRLDHILAKVTKMSRTSLQKVILQGLVRINDRVETKRALEVNEGADIQIFMEPVDENPKLALVKRICVMQCPFDVEIGYKFEVRIWKEYYTDNWKMAGRKRGQIEEEEEEEKR